MEVLQEGKVKSKERMTAESVRETAEAKVQALQARIETAAIHQRLSINDAIKQAADAGQVSARFTHEANIDDSVYSRDEITFIKFCIDATSAMVVESLTADGFEASTRTEERLGDPRSGTLYPPYYVTDYEVTWQ